MANFNAKNTAKEILKSLTKIKVSTGVKLLVGKKGTELKEIELRDTFKGYDNVRKSVNRATEKYYGEDCVLIIGDNKVEFKGGKFSNELLKMLERCTTEFFYNGDYFNIYSDYDVKLKTVKTVFLNPNITIVDLVPIAAQFSGLDKKDVAVLGYELANHENFVKTINDFTEGLRLIAEADENAEQNSAE